MWKLIGSPVSCCSDLALYLRQMLQSKMAGAQQTDFPTRGAAGMADLHAALWWLDHLVTESFGFRLLDRVCSSDRNQEKTINPKEE